MKQKANNQLSKGNALKTGGIGREGSMRFVIRDRASGVTHERWPHPTTSGPSCAVSRIMRESSGSMRATTSGCEAERSTRSAGSCERRYSSTRPIEAIPRSHGTTSAPTHGTITMCCRVPIASK